MSLHEVNLATRKNNQKTPFEALVFDCDGVLFDSKDANVRFYNHILAAIGCPLVRPDQQDYIHMHPVNESLRYLLPSNRELREALDYCHGIDFSAFNSYLRCEPGLVDLLGMAKAKYSIALATNRTVSTHEVLAHFNLDQYFDLVVSASDVNFPKPHPETMERILSTFGVTPEQVLYVGDSAVDEALAHATGVYFVAYKNRKLDAHMHIDHFEQLHSVIFSKT